MSSLKRLQNGRYYVLKKLGEGGKGIVFKAKDTVLNRVVAVKMLKKAFEEVFKVKVDKINTMITREGKKKAFIKLKKEYSAADVAVKLGMI